MQNSFHKQKLKEALATYRPVLYGYISTGLKEAIGKRTDLHRQIGPNKTEKNMCRKQEIWGHGLTNIITKGSLLRLIRSSILFPQKRHNNVVRSVCAKINFESSIEIERENRS